MSVTYSAFNHKEWEDAGLRDFSDFSECARYVNQSEYGDGQLEGGWYYVDDESGAMIVYYGFFGNDNSPGASVATYADVFDCREEYREFVDSLEKSPEYADE